MGNGYKHLLGLLVLVASPFVWFSTARAQLEPPPPYVVSGVVYFRLGDLNNGIGTVRKTSDIYYRLTINNRQMQFRRGFKTVMLWKTNEAQKYQKLLKSPVISYQGFLHMPIYALGYMGCTIDTRNIKARLATVDCGAKHGKVRVKVWYKR